MSKSLVASPASVREMDRRTIQDYGLPGVVLMENAGRGAAEVALEMLGGRENPEAAIVCGKGNNGGDGFVIARYLHNAGVRVAIALLTREDEIAPGSDPAVHFGVIRRMGILTVEMPDAAKLTELLGGADLVVDAILGTGLAGEVRGPARAAIDLINACGHPVLAVDVPSGLCAETGRMLGVAVRATRTATFAAAKSGFFRLDGPAHTGRVHVIEIGMPREVVEDLAAPGSSERRAQ